MSEESFQRTFHFNQKLHIRAVQKVACRAAPSRVTCYNGGRVLYLCALAAGHMALVSTQHLAGVMELFFIFNLSFEEPRVASGWPLADAA